MITLMGLKSFMGDAGKGRFFDIICLIYTVVILIAGLWPFNFNPVNKAEWLKNERGIRFYLGQGIVFSPEPLTAREPASENTAVTIELLIRPDKEPDDAVSSILTLCRNGQSDQFILGQWKSELIVRVPVIKAKLQERYHEIAVGGALMKRMTRLITVSSGKNATDIYIDGMRKKQFSQYALIRDNQGLSGHLILGVSPVGTAPWTGSLLGLAIYDRTLNAREVLDHDLAWRQGGKQLLALENKPIALYLFDERSGQRIQNHAGSHNDLLLPATFKPFHRMILGMPNNDQWFSRTNQMDVIINILGFIPFGFFLLAWLQQDRNFSAPLAYGVTMLLGCFLSLSIELTQAYLPTRDSSLLDLLNNILGTAAGMLLLKYTIQIIKRVKSKRLR